MTKRVLRFEVPIDDRAHEIPRGVPLLFERRRTNETADLQPAVDVWMEVHTPTDWPATSHEADVVPVRIVGTGQPIPDGWRWLASTVDREFVWHLYWVR